MLELVAPIHIEDNTILIPPKASINLKANLVDVSYKVNMMSDKSLVILLMFRFPMT